MMKKQKNDLDYRVQVLKALGHPTRLHIVEMLQSGEHCVCEFVHCFEHDFSTVSKHLSVLLQAGLVVSDKRGKQVYYALSDGSVDVLLHSLQCYSQEVKV